MKPAAPARAMVIEAHERPGSMTGAWVFAVIYCSIAWPIFYMAAIKSRDLAGGLITGFFAAFGVIWFAITLWKTLELMKYGEVRIALQAPLPAMGGRLQAILLLPEAAGQARQVSAKLECSRGAANPIWAVTREFPVRRSGGTSLAFEIPAEIPEPVPTDKDAAKAALTWSVIVTADLPGVDFSRRFFVPVQPPQPGQAVPAIAPDDAPDAEFAQEPAAGPSRAGIVLLVAANLLPLAGVLALGWKVGDIVFLYWFENLVVGAVNVLRIFAANPVGAMARMRKSGTELTRGGLWLGKALLAGFFIVHFGGFCAVHLEFLAYMFGERVGGRSPGGGEMMRQVLRDPYMVLSVMALIVSHLFSFFRNYIGHGEYLRVDAARLMLRPYARIVVVHLFVFAAAFAALVLKSPLAAVIAFVLIKIVVDARMHWLERRLLAKRK